LPAQADSNTQARQSRSHFDPSRELFIAALCQCNAANVAHNHGRDAITGPIGSMQRP